ncbi:MAG: J domain-containing protein [Polaromonas sp.]|uniref:J domain-containing protein n=1 Tax=Polaromonas sp. TaxID=1869339 RepID=UPI00273186DD|nr:J domain-containing protein [Polaromonas sp.]MDP2452301.1 J domain-containing protein [Polaromonas sp.]MDP3245872.1 J domain-containing protein [Polaromonas sp.]MDP3755003.1 J domain-containing protein [Polaromonas sp.]MDP3826139.1 J domain-containing protein [Polaromonas sp.]
MKYKDYYAALGVPRDADTEQIKKAYRKLARQHHPDVSKAPDAEARFKEAGEAYATLKDPEKRAAYDQLGRRPAGEEFAPPPQWRHDFGAEGQGFEGVDLADLLAAMGRGRGPSRGPVPMHGRDYETSVRITLEDAHHGASVKLDLADEEGGRTLEVTIPAGVTEGQKLRLRGKGGKGRNGGADGDIYLHIMLAPHGVFRADHHDLYFDLALAPWEAALGADVEVPTLDGPVVLTVPPGTHSGRKLRLRGRGLANGRGGRGDLYAAVRIDVPATLTERERELFGELAKASHFNPRAPAGKEKFHGTTTA